MANGALATAATPAHVQQVIQAILRTPATETVDLSKVKIMESVEVAEQVSETPAPEKPKPLAPLFANFPHEMKQCRQWVLWKLEHRGEKPTKVPYQVNGAHASSTNPANWNSFELVQQTFETSGSYDGIGFVFAGQHSGCDFDHVINPTTGEFHDPAMKEEVLALNGWVELSQSGTGCHVIGKYSGDAIKGHKTGQREAYTSGRFFALTGQCVPGISQPETLPDNTAEFKAHHAKQWGEAKPAGAHEKRGNYKLSPLKFEELPEPHQTLVNELLTTDKDFTKLWTGDVEHLVDASGRPDRSRADFALALKLAKHIDGKEDILDVMLTCEKLWRAKWSRGDYLRLTISEAQSTVEVMAKRSFRIGSIEEAIKYGNDRFFVAPYGNKTPIWRNDYDQGWIPVLKEGFNGMMCTTMVNVNPRGAVREAPFPEVWFNDAGRQYYDGVFFGPNQHRAGHFNLWQGFSVEPTAGSWEKMRWHIENVICAGDPVSYSYVLDWLALAVQRPEVRPGVALVLLGLTGTGKGIFGNAIRRLFGKHGIVVRNMKHLSGQFNGHLDRCALLFVDEAAAVARTDVGIVNGYITDETFGVERKGFDLVQTDNYLHVIMASNDKHVIWATPDERRYCVLDVSDAKMGDRTYFKELAHELDNGGMEAMLHDLLERDISTFDPGDYPSTKALSNQIIESFSTEDQWLLETLVDGEIKGEKWGTHAKASVIQGYRESGGVMESVGFSRWLFAAVKGAEPGKDTLTSGAPRVQTYRFPPLDVCRKQFEKRIRSEIDWETGMIK